MSDASVTNHQWRLAARPRGLPVPSDWEFRDEAVPSPGEGELLVRVLYISLDPAMRGWMNAGRSYIPPVGIGEVMRALGAGEVIESRHPGFAAGDQVTGSFGVQAYALSDGSGVSRVSTAAAPLTTYLSVLGMTGMTAYFGLLDIGKPVAGETVVVSGAAGAVGMVVGQIAKIKGCRVVGIAGGEAKGRWLVDELGFDAVADYKAGNLRAQLKEHAPGGIDVYFDNVGGDIFETCLFAMNNFGRIACCGALSQYDGAPPAHGPRGVPGLIVTKRLTLRGFVMYDFDDRRDEALKDLQTWVAQGKLKVQEDILQGLENTPAALIGLLAGENRGKRMVKV
jgi:hypothetical protein